MRNDNDDGLANRFIGGVAEDTRRPPVPICDDAIELLCKAQLWIILVTTSQFGPDAYSFAKDKPLTLLSGSELLGLLEQHGYKFRIDLQEATRLARTRTASA